MSNNKINKFLLYLLLSLSCIGSSYADALCNDGWISKSSGSGTCSWHGGVKKWLEKNKPSNKNNKDKYAPTNEPIGKCKGNYKQRKACQSQRALIMQTDMYKFIMDPDFRIEYEEKQRKKRELEIKRLGELLEKSTTFN